MTDDEVSASVNNFDESKSGFSSVSLVPGIAAVHISFFELGFILISAYGAAGTILS